MGIYEELHKGRRQANLKRLGSYQRTFYYNIPPSNQFYSQCIHSLSLCTSLSVLYGFNLLAGWKSFLLKFNKDLPYQSDSNGDSRTS